ncbi:MAG: hypothetical protein ACI9K2_000946 [Myxococcota bacterium]
MGFILLTIKEKGMKRTVITHHAHRRAVQRLGTCHTRLTRLHSASIRLPARYARTFGIRTPRCKSGVRFRVAGEVLFVCRRRVVLTVWRLSTAELATVLLWAASGVWLGRSA